MPTRLCLTLLLALGACNSAPEPGPATDKSAEGAMARKAVADVDAAQLAVAAKPAN